MIRVGVIGAGAWGLNHVRIVSAHPHCKLVAVADPAPGASSRVAALCDAPAFADPEQLLSDSTIDAVVIASPAPTHATLALAAFDAGKHVLVEKPVAMRIADANALVVAARAHARIGMVGHLMVHHPAVRRLKELLISGQLGHLHYLHSTRVNLGRLRHDETALWSFGPHDLSMIDFLVDRAPQSVTARGQSVLQPGIEDVVFLTLRYPSGEMAHIHLSWLSPRKERRLTLVCSSKMIEFDDVATDKLRIYDRGYSRPPEFTEYGQYLTLRDGDVHIPLIPMEEPLKVQFQHFLDCIATRTEPVTDLASGVRVTRILEAAERSLSLDGMPVLL